MPKRCRKLHNGDKKLPSWWEKDLHGHKRVTSPNCSEDELEANELRTRLAKPEEAEGADDEEDGAPKAAAAAVNLQGQ